MSELEDQKKDQNTTRKSSMEGYLEASSRLHQPQHGRSSIVFSNESEINYTRDGTEAGPSDDHEKVEVKGEMNVMRMGAIMQQLKRRSSVTNVTGKVDRKLILSYKAPPAQEAPSKTPSPEKSKKKKKKKKKEPSPPPPPPPEQSEAKSSITEITTAQETKSSVTTVQEMKPVMTMVQETTVEEIIKIPKVKKKKKKLPMITVKSRGIGTEPPATTVDSGTWTDLVPTVNQHIGTYSAISETVGVQVEMEVFTVSKAHVGISTDSWGVSVGVGSEIYTEDRETETTVVKLDKGLDPLPELDVIASKPQAIKTKSCGVMCKPSTTHKEVANLWRAPETRSQAVLSKPETADKEASTLWEMTSIACGSEEKELRDKDVLAQPEMRDSECHPKPPDIRTLGISAVAEMNVKSSSTTDLRTFRDTSMETTRKHYSPAGTVTDLRTYRHMWTSTRNRDGAQLGKLERNLGELRRQRKEILRATEELFGDVEEQRKLLNVKRVLEVREKRRGRRRTEDQSSCSCEYHLPHDPAAALEEERTCCPCVICAECYATTTSRPPTALRSRACSGRSRAYSELLPGEVWQVNQPGYTTSQHGYNATCNGYECGNECGFTGCNVTRTGAYLTQPECGANCSCSRCVLVGRKGRRRTHSLIIYAPDKMPSPPSAISSASSVVDLGRPVRVITPSNLKGLLWVH